MIHLKCITAYQCISAEGADTVRQNSNIFLKVMAKSRGSGVLEESNDHCHLQQEQERGSGAPLLSC